MPILRIKNSQAPPFEIEPSLQKMMFAQSPRFRGEAMKSELDRREQEVINKNPVLSGKPEEEAGNKEVANPRKGRKSQFEHNRLLKHIATYLTQCCTSDC
uniref:TPX2 C-terminal domain-containing protein n=1 Tax=Parascaris univalens TaxID=6257 RepID=A0A914ZX77_PARUN